MLSEKVSERIGQLRLTIGAKLVSLIAVLLLTSIITLVWLSTRMFIDDNTALIQQMNSDTANGLASEMRNQFGNLSEKARILGAMMLEHQNKGSRAYQEFFAGDQDLSGVFLYQKSAATEAKLIDSVVSVETKQSADPQGVRALKVLMGGGGFSLPQLEKGDVQVSKLTLPDGSAGIAVGLPLIKSGNVFSHLLIIFFKQSLVSRSFSNNDLVTTFMVDRKGQLLAHPDATRLANHPDASSLGVVQQLLQGFNNGQTRYVDSESKQVRLGSFKMVGFGGLGVIAELPEAKAFEAAHKVQYRSMLIALIVLSLSFFAGYYFSGTITWPLKELTAAAQKISEGDFNIHLQPKGKDELATLSESFNHMALGLVERDKVKETFNKFHNKEIAEKLLSGEVKLGGERKEATIFFSDVRGFTGMSETMAPEEVVEMLNEYMTRMVRIIRAHHGIVDKYVGDAIMAIWGVPIGRPDDTSNAVKACLEMRKELAVLNELRISRGQAALRIGMGLNRGSVVAGNIGSDEKMEYTVIGDSVNLASRMESMTKEYGTDLLISNNVRTVIKNQFIFEQAPSAMVKGKSEPIEVFRVLGYVDEQGVQHKVETPYSSYTSEKSDKVEKVG